MSQQQAIQQEEQQGQLPGNAGAVSADDDFYAGFDIDLDAAPASQPDGQQDAGKKEEQQTPQTEQVPQTPPQDAPQADPLDFFQADEPTAGQAAQQPPQTQQAEPPRQVEIAEEIKDEYERLKVLNARAAALAAEDSPEGQAVRARLEGVGAESAEDKAESLLLRREQERRRQAAAEEQIKAHNARFAETLRREVPEYFALVNDKARVAEAHAYINGVYGWIASKPYGEGAQLMAIARSGRDPVKVAGLIKAYEAERSGGKAAPAAKDHTAMLAMPGRGGGSAAHSSGIGDKDDFDAGFYYEPPSSK